MQIFCILWLPLFPIRPGQGAIIQIFFLFTGSRCAAFCPAAPGFYADFRKYQQNCLFCGSFLQSACVFPLLLCRPPVSLPRSFAAVPLLWCYISGVRSPLKEICSRPGAVPLLNSAAFCVRLCAGLPPPFPVRISAAPSPAGLCFRGSPVVHCPAGALFCFRLFFAAFSLLPVNLFLPVKK